MRHDPALLRDALAVAPPPPAAPPPDHRAPAGPPRPTAPPAAPPPLVTEVDRLSEAAIRAEIVAAFPGHAVLGEEQGQGSGDARFRWIVDPLDGTVNYAHGVPFYCVSVALEADGEVVAGVVLDTSRDERFAAVLGGGATRNGAPIEVSRAAAIGEAMLATGFAYGGDLVRRNLEVFARIVPMARAVRRPGAAALDLCYVACGRFDGFWEYALNAWDVAAGLLITREAGGTVTGAGGAPYAWNDELMVASNGHLHARLLALVAPGTTWA